MVDYNLSICLVLWLDCDPMLFVGPILRVLNSGDPELKPCGLLQTASGCGMLCGAVTKTGWVENKPVP